MTEEKAYQEIRNNLIQKYKTNIMPKIAELEKKRQSIVKPLDPFKNFKKILIILGIPFLIGYIGIPVIIIFVLILCCIIPSLPYIDIFAYSDMIFTIFFVVTVIPLIIFCLYVLIGLFIYSRNCYKFQTVQKNIKSIVMPIFCSCFPDLKWVPEKEHLTEMYKIANILPKFDFLEYDDCFIGSYKGVNFVIEEVNASVKRTDGSPYSVFRGAVIRFKDFNKKFKGHTIIKPDIYIFSPSKKLHKAEMEDIVFEKDYNVFTNDDVEARYLITTSFIDRIKSIKSVFNANKVFVSFICGNFFLGLKTYENLFDYGQIFNSLNDSKPFIKMSEEIISILKLIDHFKLDQKIGM